MKKPPLETTLLSQKQAADALSITRSAVSQLVKKKLIEFTEIGGHKLITLRGVEQYKQNRPLSGWGGYQKRQKKLREIRLLKESKK